MPNSEINKTNFLCLGTKTEAKTVLMRCNDTETSKSIFVLSTDLDDFHVPEPFNNWLDDKMLPLLDDVDSAVHCVPISPVKVEDLKPAVVPDTPSLLKEFETVLGAVGMSHDAVTSLTPPQSPPYEQPMLTTLEPIVYPRTPLSVPLDFPPVSTLQPDVARELAVVDELVRTRAEDMVQWSGPSSPSCSNSSFGDCSSDDPEWIPEIVGMPSTLKQVEKPSRKRSKPYTKIPTEEKKSRKKEQNKNAATRYRQKKKQEVEEILEEERNLQKQNEELDGKICDLQREIKYLKGLMRDLFRAKGLIN